MTKTCLIKSKEFSQLELLYWDFLQCDPTVIPRWDHSCTVQSGVFCHSWPAGSRIFPEVMAISAQLWLLVLLRQPARPLHSREREIGERMRRVTYKISFSYYALKVKLRVNIREIMEPAENA